ncbi:hypothetical protein [Nesterenkonia sp. Act20]|uniref:hypothetical protein n=1 Tax=Nesterenkonia sp. Act20 TaxID=1483432 RepID=UPI001C44D1FE|nr:hypothetical protein [Nesterenkonia sp. Act20]
MDSRFPTHYLNDRRVLRASLPAFRQFVLGTAWSVSNMTDGFISHEDLPLVQFSSTEHAAELVNLGLWKQDDNGYLIADFQKFQTSAAQMGASTENRLERDRTRKQRDRRHERGDHSMCQPGKCPHAPQRKGMSTDSPRTIEGRGKAEAERKEEEVGVPESQGEVDLQTGEITSAPSSARISNATPEGVSTEHPPEYVRPTHTPGPDELFGDPPVDRAPDGPSTFDFNAFRNPAMREGAA